jgi:hypothetical protein
MQEVVVELQVEQVVLVVEEGRRHRVQKME